MPSYKPTIGVLTSEESFLNNYGAVLQGFALTRALSDLGFDPFVIRYEYVGPRRRFPVLKDAIKYLIRGSEYRKIANGKILAKKSFSSQRELFRKFQEEFIQFESQKRYSWETILKAPFAFDAYVCGSDQIWNPVFKNDSNDRGYFLDFVPAGTLRIAYAPSIGVSSIPESCKEEMAELLGKMDSISVREIEGARIIREITGEDCLVAVDPTLLLSASDWRKIQRPVENMPDKYILVYQFRKSERFDNGVKAVEEMLGAKAIDIALSEVSLLSDREKRFDVGPSEFLWLIDNAECVITDSFHASVFSILFDTPFVVFGRESFGGIQANMDGRITTLLSMFSLDGCYVGASDPIENAVNRALSSAKSDKAFAEKKKESLIYLEKSLRSLVEE